MGREVVMFDPVAHRYTHDGREVPGVTSIIKAAGLVDDAWFNDYARDRGKAVHEATALDDDGILDDASVDPAIAGYIAAWRRFKSESGFQSLFIERVLFNETYRYAGTVDRIGMIGGQTWVIDFKTGEVQPWVALQTSAYAMAYGKQNIRRAGVKLSDDGTYRLKEFKDRNDYTVFLACLTVINWKKGNSNDKRT